MDGPGIRSGTPRRGAKPVILIGHFFLADFLLEIIDLFWWLK